jgi:hypothetical protein
MFERPKIVLTIPLKGKSKEGKQDMKKIIACTWRFLAFGAVIFVGTLTAHADSYTLTLSNVNNSSQNGGEYIGPYNFALNDSTTNVTNNIALMCINLNDLISVGESWSVTIATAAQLDAANSTTKYLEVAYLNSIVAANQGSNTGYLAQWAAWYLFNPTNSNFTTSGGNVYVNGDTGIGSITAELATAASAIASNGAAYSNYQFFSPTSNTSGWTNGLPQTLVGNTNIATTPEPGSLLLLGTALMMFAFMAYRKSTPVTTIS